MPLNSEGPFSHLRQEFCLALKASRERNGVTLAEIADATKVPASLFAALERNDLRHWPNGIFRRAFFRDYARMIGLPVAQTCAEFVRLFPDATSLAVAQPAEPSAEQPPADELRLSFDAGWHGARARIPSRLLAASIDGVLVLLIAAACAWWMTFDLWATTTAVAFLYFSVATTVFGESPAIGVLTRRGSLVEMVTRWQTGLARARSRVRVELPESLKARRIEDGQTSLFNLSR